MKDIIELLETFGKDWHLDKRNDLYKVVLNEWQDNQVEMIHEEGNELIIRLAQINLLISKMRRQKKNGVIHYLELLNEFTHQPHMIGNLADELADYMIVEDQFNLEFIEKVIGKLLFKLNRLKNRIRIEKEKEERKK